MDIAATHTKHGRIRAARLRNLLAFIDEHQRANHFPPNIAEMRKATGSRYWTIESDLTWLVNIGLLKKGYWNNRNHFLTDAGRGEIANG